MSGAGERSSSQGRDLGAHERVDRLERRRGAQRAQELQGLGRGQQLDREDAAGVGHRTRRLARGGHAHRHVVFLVGRGGDGVDARGMGQDLVLGGERRGGDMGDHETRLEAALAGEEGRQAGERRG